MTTNRIPDYPIDSQFLDRWSPRAFSDRALSEEQVLTVLEAARWAPSGANLQPWRFIYGVRGEQEFNTLLSLLVPFNEGWAKNAGALIFVTSVSSFDGERPVRSASFDAGAATLAMALQAHKMGLAAHAMGGLEYEKAPLVLNLPENVRVEAAIAIGYQGEVSALSEALQQRETPSVRQPLSAIAFKGRFEGEVKSPA